MLIKEQFHFKQYILILLAIVFFQGTSCFIFDGGYFGVIGRMSFQERFIYTTSNVLGFCYYPRNVLFATTLLLQRDINRSQMKKKSISDQSLITYSLNLKPLEDPLLYYSKVYKKSNVTRIPLITHRVWITSNESPIELTNFLREQLLQNLNKTYYNLDSSAAQRGLNWTHYLWIQDKSLLPETVQLFQSYGVVVKELKDLKLFDEKTKFQFDFYLQDFKAAAAASDLMRGVVVAEHGGIYFDNDFKIDEWDYNINYLFDYYGISLYLWAARFTLNGFFAAKKGHPIVVHYMEQMKDSFSLIEEERPHYMNECIFKTTAMIMFGTGPSVLGATAYNFINQDGNQDYIVFEYNEMSETQTTMIDENGEEKPVTIKLNGRDGYSASWLNDFRDYSKFGWSDLNQFN
ncbi:UNKNOWN [Stylonychia lemnae]|uniref:Uncharacterized protein n=1 Tax=Stylonychia lemnae TaxID=5949 RepID=A0A078ABN4_STYLE|nr:UNKNOWN [Stylonychia lemnae]|eukprot:CDW79594.1 UNKNOWN [Stylonychia lemnae]